MSFSLRSWSEQSAAMALGLILGASVLLMKCDGADIISILSPWLGIKNSCSLASTKRIKVLRGAGERGWGSAKHSVSVLSAGNGEQTGDSPERPVHYPHNRLATHPLLFFILCPACSLSFTDTNEKMSLLMVLLSLFCHLFALSHYSGVGRCS